jgi:nucleoid-associated protein YgaU
MRSIGAAPAGSPASEQGRLEKARICVFRLDGRGKSAQIPTILGDLFAARVFMSMLTASKVVLALCTVAVGGAVVVLGPNVLHRLGAPEPSEVASTVRPEADAAAKPETKSETTAETSPAAKPADGPELASAAPDAPLAAAPPAAANPSATQPTVALTDPAPAKPETSTAPTGPRFDVARVDPDGVGVIAGVSTPGAKVELMRDGEVLDSAVADQAGQFVMTPQKLPAGQYELRLRARSPDGTVTQSSAGVAVALNDTTPPPRLASASKDAVIAKPAEPKAVIRTDPKTMSANAATTATSREATGALASVINRMVARGDSLWAISRHIYGDGARYSLIFQANRGKINNPDLIYPGQTFVLPKR